MNSGFLARVFYRREKSARERAAGLGTRRVVNFETPRPPRRSTGLDYLPVFNTVAGEGVGELDVFSAAWFNHSVVFSDRRCDQVWYLHLSSQYWRRCYEKRSCGAIPWISRGADERTRSRTYGFCFWGGTRHTR